MVHRCLVNLELQRDLSLETGVHLASAPKRTIPHPIAETESANVKPQTTTAIKNEVKIEVKEEPTEPPAEDIMLQFYNSVLKQ